MITSKHRINTENYKIEFLKKFFPEFTRENPFLVVYYLELKEYGANQVVFRKDDLVDAVYFVKSGLVNLSLSVKDRYS